MEGVRYFIWLGSLSITPVLYYRSITEALVIAVLIAFSVKLPVFGDFFRWRSLLAFFPAASGLVMVILGTVLRPTSAHLGGIWPTNMIWTIFFSNFPIGVFAVGRIVRFRLLAVTLLLLGTWIAFWCAYYSGASITGAWYEL